MANGKLYTVKDVELNKNTFPEAKAFCAAMGEHVTLYEPKDQKTISAMNPFLDTSVWVNAEQAGDTGTTFKYSDGTTVPQSLFHAGEPNMDSEKCLEANYGHIANWGNLDSDGRFNDITCSSSRNLICQKDPVTHVNPDCTDTSSHGKLIYFNVECVVCSKDLHLFSGRYTAFNSQTEMENALDYFCPLSKEKQQAFIDCPQVTFDATKFFSLAKEIDCKGKEDMAEYTSGCDFICQGIKTQGLSNVKAAMESSKNYYKTKIAKLEEENQWQSKVATSLTAIAQICQEYRGQTISDDPTAVEAKFHAKIDETVSLSDAQKTDLKARVSKTIEGVTVYEPTTNNEIEADLMRDIVIEKGKAEGTARTITEALGKQNKVTALAESITA